MYKVFARWADDGSLWQAFLASVRHLAAEQHLDTSVLHGDGPNTVAKKGRWDWLLGPQTPERGEGHRYHRQLWLRLSACSRGPRQRDGHDPVTEGAESVEAGGQTGRGGPERRLSQSRWRF